MTHTSCPAAGGGAEHLWLVFPYPTAVPLQFSSSARRCRPQSHQPQSQGKKQTAPYNWLPKPPQDNTARNSCASSTCTNATPCTNAQMHMNGGGGQVCGSGDADTRAVVGLYQLEHPASQRKAHVACHDRVDLILSRTIWITRLARTNGCTVGQMLMLPAENDSFDSHQQLAVKSQ